MNHELSGKTDKQLLKASKLELLGYIRELEDSVGHPMLTTDTIEYVEPPTPLTSYSFGNTTQTKDIYSF